jgi:hypothetical protein
VYTLAVLLAVLPHLDRLGRLLRGRPRPAAARLATAHPAHVRDPD